MLDPQRQGKQIIPKAASREFKFFGERTVQLSKRCEGHHFILILWGEWDGDNLVHTGGKDHVP